MDDVGASVSSAMHIYRVGWVPTRVVTLATIIGWVHKLIIQFIVLGRWGESCTY